MTIPPPDQSGRRQGVSPGSTPPAPSSDDRAVREPRVPIDGVAAAAREVVHLDVPTTPEQLVDTPPLRPADVQVRAATKADHPTIRELFEEGADEGHLRHNDTGADMADLDAAYFGDDGDSGFWVACHGDEIVGMIGVQRTAEGAADVRRLRVRPTWRRRGIGTRLLEQAVDFCRERGYLKVVLDVRIERGPAITLFEKFGFSHARTREIDGRRTVDFYLDLYRDSRA